MLKSEKVIKILQCKTWGTPKSYFVRGLANSIDATGTKYTEAVSKHTHIHTLIIKKNRSETLKLIIFSTLELCNLKLSI